MVLDEAVEEKAGGERVRLGMVVIRGNSVIMLEVGAISLQIMGIKLTRSCYRHSSASEEIETGNGRKMDRCTA